MKIVHLSTYVSDSSACMKLHKALCNYGIDSKIITIKYNGSDKPHKVIEVGKGSIKNRFLRRLEKEVDNYSLIDKKYPFNSDYCGNFDAIVSTQEFMEADIIHLHWICGFVSIKDTLKLSKLSKRIVWTFHDIWPMTGGCHVLLNGCTKYKENCMECQFLKKRNNISARVLESKKKSFSKCNISIITPSDWLSNLVKDSFLFSSKVVTTIPNVLENAEGIKKNDQACRLILNNRYNEFENGYINILFVATSIYLPYKGYRYFEKTFEKLFNDNRTLAKRIKIHIVGEADNNSEVIKKYKNTIWGYVNNNDYLYSIYSKCDILFNPSLADSFSYVVCESLACGTPVLAFETGGITNLIDNKASGYLAKYLDEEDLYKGLLWMINSDCKAMGEFGRSKVISQCSEKNVVEKHVKIYSELIRN